VLRLFFSLVSCWLYLVFVIPFVVCESSFGSRSSFIIDGLWLLYGYLLTGQETFFRWCSAGEVVLLSFLVQCWVGEFYFLLFHLLFIVTQYIVVYKNIFFLHSF
jgi:hypothetical protein